MPRAAPAWPRRSWLPLLLEGPAVNPITIVWHVIGLLPNLTVIQFGIACIVVGALGATGLCLLAINWSHIDDPARFQQEPDETSVRSGDDIWPRMR